MGGGGEALPLPSADNRLEIFLATGKVRVVGGGPPSLKGISRRTWALCHRCGSRASVEEGGGEAAGPGPSLKVSEVREGMDEAFSASASCSFHPTPARGPFLGWDFPFEVRTKEWGS